MHVSNAVKLFWYVIFICRALVWLQGAEEGTCVWRLDYIIDSHNHVKVLSSYPFHEQQGKTDVFYEEGKK